MLMYSQSAWQEMQMSLRRGYQNTRRSLRRGGVCIEITIKRNPDPLNRVTASAQAELFARVERLFAPKRTANAIGAQAVRH